MSLKQFIREAIKAMYRSVMLFGYRRLCAMTPNTMPTGVPGHRDPDNRCDFYMPVAGTARIINTCWGDGHYLCRECCLNFTPEDGE